MDILDPVLAPDIFEIPQGLDSVDDVDIITKAPAPYSSTGVSRIFKLQLVCSLPDGRVFRETMLNSDMARMEIHIWPEYRRSSGPRTLELVYKTAGTSARHSF